LSKASCRRQLPKPTALKATVCRKARRPSSATWRLRPQRGIVGQKCLCRANGETLDAHLPTRPSPSLPPFFRVRKDRVNRFFTPRRLYLRLRATRDHALAARVVIDARESNIGSAYHRREGVICCAGERDLRIAPGSVDRSPGLGGIGKRRICRHTETRTCSA
jgi:hypothetical protein